MTVQKRKRDDEPDFQGFIEGNTIPPHLVEALESMEPGSRWPEPGPPLGSAPESEPEPQPDPSAEYRMDILGRAAHIVTQDRNVAYGPPEQTFERIAAMWAAYLGIDVLLAADVAAMLALMKIARIATNPLHEDSWIDLAGYAACGADVARGLQESLPEQP